ncbi:MAG TPA: tetratricopeptide repeat protein [Terriglobales bacterium]|nr:tetratricopeptide repeat protein [Terriglobales bacterium]
MPEAAPAAATIQFHSPTPILSVKDLNVSLDYYARTLGFKTDFIQSGIIASVSRGACHIFLVEGDQGHPGSWVWIGVSDSAQLYEEYQASGAKIRVPPTNRPWGYEMQVEDPDGHVLRFGSDQKPDEPFGEWLDMHGTRWTPLPQGRWKPSDRLTDADQALQAVGSAWQQGKKDEVRHALEQAVELWRKSGNQVELAHTLRTLGEFERKAGDLERAKAYYEEAIALLRGENQLAHLADAVRHLGDIHHKARRPAEAEAAYREALALYRQEAKLRSASQRNLDVGNVLRRLAIVKEEAGDNASARDLWQQAYESYARTGYQPALAESAAWVARLAHRLGTSGEEWLAQAEKAALHCEEDTKAHVEKVRAEIG